MDNQHRRPGPHGHSPHWLVWATGLGSLLWLLLRSGTSPRRLAYPCQRAALASGTAFLGWLLAVAGVGALYRSLRRGTTLGRLAALGLALLLVVGLAGSSARSTAEGVRRSPVLPAWTSPTAVSSVYVVAEVPVPECSLDGGALPSTPPCDDPAYALHDAGVDALVAEMEARGDHFYETTAHPGGVVGSDDVVIVKVNNQWGGLGDGAGVGRLATSTDVLKGLIWRVLQHPEGFTGEVVVAENTQYVMANYDIAPANAQDQDQSYADVVAAFAGLGYPVSTVIWDYLNDSLLDGGTVGGPVPPGEYASGDATDGYLLVEDPAGSGADELSYPKFQTPGGHFVSLRHGLWDGSSYAADRVTLVNLPVLKKHGMAGATVSWKNLIGFSTIANDPGRFGSWDAMHGFYWGYQDLGDATYGLIGRQLALIRAPDLNIVDAIWVATQDNTWGEAVRSDVLVASTDPFAADWYASEYVLRPVVVEYPQDSSAARAGTFRNATRVNQNAAAAAWPGTYPWVDLLDGYDGDEPSPDEQSQMNVYLVGGSGGIFADGFDGGTTGAWSSTSP